jgi:hypothetical protein
MEQERNLHGVPFDRDDNYAWFFRRGYRVVGPMIICCAGSDDLTLLASPVRPRFGRTFCRKDKRVPFGLVATPL